MNPKFEIYTDQKGAFRFRLKDSTGQVIAVSKKQYDDKREVQADITRVKELCGPAEVKEI